MNPSAPGIDVHDDRAFDRYNTVALKTVKLDRSGSNSNAPDAPTALRAALGLPDNGPSLVDSI